MVSISTKSVLRVLVSLTLVCQPGLPREEFWKWLCYGVFSSPASVGIWLLPITSTLTTAVLVGGCYLLYWLELPWFEKRRAYPPGTPWPWKDPDPKVRADYRKLEWSAVRRLFTALVILLPTAVVFTAWSDPKLPLLLPEMIPSRLVVALQLYAMIMCNSIYSYWVHRAFHTRLLYPYHKIHHEFKSPTILAAYNVHILEVTSATIGFGLFFHLLGLHLYTQIIFVLIAQTSLSVGDHSGYDIEIWQLPVDGKVDSGNHDIHHRTSVNHNFGGDVMWWDMLFGTYMKPLKKISGCE